MVGWKPSRRQVNRVSRVRAQDGPSTTTPAIEETDERQRVPGGSGSGRSVSPVASWIAPEAPFRYTHARSATARDGVNITREVKEPSGTDRARKMR